jgi:hypothetical protein
VARQEKRISAAAIADKNKNDKRGFVLLTALRMPEDVRSG